MAVRVASDLFYYALNICQKLGMPHLVGLGMPHLVGLVLECLERTKSQPDAPADPDGLTQREVEVFRFNALGRSDRDIARVGSPRQQWN